MGDTLDLTAQQGNTSGHAHALAAAILASEVRAQAFNAINAGLGVGEPPFTTLSARSAGSSSQGPKNGEHSVLDVFGSIAQNTQSPSEALTVWQQTGTGASYGQLTMRRDGADAQSLAGVARATENMRLAISGMVGPLLTPGKIDLYGNGGILPGSEQELKHTFSNTMVDIANNYQRDMAALEALGLKPMSVGISYQRPEPLPGPLGEQVERIGHTVNRLLDNVESLYPGMAPDASPVPAAPQNRPSRGAAPAPGGS